MDPYVALCAGLERAGVRYLVIGAFGINLYASRVEMVITTADCDLLLPPEVDVLGAALAVLRSQAFELEAGGEPLIDVEGPTLNGIVRARARVTGRRPDAQVDLALEAAGLDFEDLWSRHRTVTLDGVDLRLAPLRDLVRSKELLGRPKDRAFLEAYREVLDRAMREDESGD